MYCREPTEESHAIVATDDDGDRMPGAVHGYVHNDEDYVKNDEKQCEYSKVDVLYNPLQLPM